MLLERLNYAAKRFGSARALCAAAGLSPGYLGTLTTRLRRDPEAFIDALPAIKIAEAAGVSVAWLLTGKGSRDQRVPLNLSALLRRLPASAYPDVVINQALLFGASRERDMAEAVWRDYLDGLHRELRHVELAAQLTDLAPSQPPALKAR